MERGRHGEVRDRPAALGAVGAIGASRSSVPAAASIRIVSTAYSGMPSARAMIVARPAPSEARSTSPRAARRSRHLAAAQGASAMKVRVPVPQPGRRSISSGRASVTTVNGTPELQSSRWSMKSSRPASAQWRSSNIRTTGPRRGDPLEERAPRREQLLAAAAAPPSKPSRASRARLDPAALGPHRRRRSRATPAVTAVRVGRLVVGLDQAGRAADHLAERPEGDAFAVGRRPAAVPVDRVDEPIDVLGRTPAPSGSCRCRPRPMIDTRRGRCSRAVAWNSVLEQAELVVAADEGRLDLVAAAATAALGDDPDGAERRYRRDLALEHLVAGWLEGDGRIRGLLGLLADKDRARLGHALEPRRGVDEVACDQPWFVAPTVTAASPVRTPARAWMPGPEGTRRRRPGRARRGRHVRRRHRGRSARPRRP